MLRYTSEASASEGGVGTTTLLRGLYLWQVIKLPPWPQPLLGHELATFTATVSNGDNGIAGTIVTAQLSRADGVTETLPLVDRGGGVYTSTWSVPDAPGYLPVSVTASGADAGTAFEREEVMMLAIAPQTVQLLGGYSDTAIDADNNGLYESLNVQMNVNSTMSGTVLLSGQLWVGNQHVAAGQTYINVVTGTQMLTLRFIGTDIYLARQDGPYTLTNLTLSDMDYGSIAVFTANNVYTTAAYRYQDFASAWALYLPLIRR